MRYVLLIALGLATAGCGGCEQKPAATEPAATVAAPADKIVYNPHAIPDGTPMDEAARIAAQKALDEQAPKTIRSPDGKTEFKVIHRKHIFPATAGAVPADSEPAKPE